LLVVAYGIGLHAIDIINQFAYIMFYGPFVCALGGRVGEYMG
jgi:hypothetical protein